MVPFFSQILFFNVGASFYLLQRSPELQPKQPIFIWNKHGLVCLILPPNDLTVFIDIGRNPGPLCSSLNNNIHPATNSYIVHRPCASAGLNRPQQRHQSCISYTRNGILFFRHLGKHCCTPTLPILVLANGW